MPIFRRVRENDGMLKRDGEAQQRPTGNNAWPARAELYADAEELCGQASLKHTVRVIREGQPSGV